MLEVYNLRVSYGKKKILRGLDFNIYRNDIVGVIGESGTGKTTLALSIIGILAQKADNAMLSGSILFNGSDILKMTESQLRSIRGKKISIVFQNVDNILNPVMTVYQQIKELINRNNNNYSIYNMLKKVGYPASRTDAYPHQLSMGEKQRVLVAMAYILEPDLVILDEPTSSLDFQSKVELVEIIKKLSNSKAVLLVTHDLDTVKRISRRTMVLYGGYIVEAGPTEKVFRKPGHPYTRGLIRSYPSASRTKDLQGMKGSPEFIEKGCCFWPRCTQAIKKCRELKPMLTGYGNRKVACHRGGIIPLINVKGISKSLGNKKILRSISFNLYEGETLALVGRSGSGKTTIAKIIMGIMPSDAGNIYLENRMIKKWDNSFYRRVQMIFQDVRSALSHRLNILDAVMEPLIIQKSKSKTGRIEAAKRVLAEVGLPTDENFTSTYPHHLSGGEIQRVVIARALILSPKIIIADEPTSSLDPSIQAKILKLLNQIQQERGLAILFITHDIGVARKVSDRAIKLLDGYTKDITFH